MSGPDPLEEAANRLYGLRPDEFTAARDSAAREAKQAGDRELAAALGRLRRPAVAAWAVNLLVRRQAALVGQVVELGEAFRQAQALLQGDALRDLTRQRRQLLSAVTAEARSLAADEGQRLSDAAARQVEDTLQAAMADPTAASAVLSGLLAQPLSSTGVESLGEALGVPPAGPVPGASEGTRPALRVVRDAGRPRREAEERVATAGAAVRAATSAYDRVAKERQKVQARVLQLEAELEELRGKVADLESESEEAVEQLTELDGEVEEAEAELDHARREAEAAAHALDSLPSR